MTDLNITVLRGTIGRPPETRQLPNGDEILCLELVIREGPRPAESVPVTWVAAPDDHGLTAGDTILVIGRTRRRFFRAGGTTQTRTDVVADVVATGTDMIDAQAEINRRLTGGLT